jgi:hypothetical protein
MKFFIVFALLVIAAQSAVIRTGLEQLQADGWSLFKGHRVGILTNPTGKFRGVSFAVAGVHLFPMETLYCVAIFSDSLDHAVDVMLKDSKASHQFDLVGVFGPEQYVLSTFRLLIFAPCCVSTFAFLLFASAPPVSLHPTFRA